ncbi:hypothetical protein [Actinomadura sp. NEAU-AAG7]|uniref:hypothetical protein n=1 Tax=Actinomadura sp. NEAU-AAG7 TaxID=2839640 RepID=UPI001BE4DFA1|nr:hypothetical protein [Actinomadura sp. NEAU-AAG7]MBT2212458.1 hypothetical protein [Actinomadura sp. NEAU-AAG7]
MMAAAGQVVSRDDLAAAVESVRELPPPSEADDGDAEWRTALVGRYGPVRTFIEVPTWALGEARCGI